VTTVSTRRRQGTTVFGYLLFVGLVAGGYFYNLTFVQLGLVDLGTRVVGLPPDRVAGHLAVLAGGTLVVALAAGVVLHRTGASARFRTKLRLLSLVVLLQTALTAVAPVVGSERALALWVLTASVALGVGVPAMFGLTCDLVATRDRGWVAAVVTSAAFLPAAVLTTDWQIERFTEQLVVPMTVGAVALTALAFVPSRTVAALAQQHASPRFGRGRFTDPDEPGALPGRGFLVAVVLMFGIYFIDSLGFLRLVDTPAYMVTAWHSADPSAPWSIGLAHVLAAALAGILYPALRQRALFGWVFVLFALAQLQYVLHAMVAPEVPASLAAPLLYAMAVSIYTVLSFTLWADFSTPRTIALVTAVGVGVSGWLASFLSTSLSLAWRSGGMPFTDHMRAVAAISLTLLMVSAVLVVSSREGAG
jgi:hypothetical protein